MLFAVLRLPGMSPYKKKPQVDLRAPGTWVGAAAGIAALIVLIAVAVGA